MCRNLEQSIYLYIQIELCMQVNWYRHTEAILMCCILNILNEQLLSRAVYFQQIKFLKKDQGTHY